MNKYWEWLKGAIDTAPEEIQQAIGEMVAEETVKGMRKGYSEIFSYGSDLYKAIKEKSTGSMSKVIEKTNFMEEWANG